jgi:arylsulfatase
VEGGIAYLGYVYVVYQHFKVRSDKAIYAGDHITGKADIAKGKGVPASVTMLVDGAPLGEGIREATPLITALGKDRCWGE